MSLCIIRALREDRSMVAAI